jgi:hypothetical protein
VVTPDTSLWRNVENVEKVLLDLEREGINRILTPHRWRCLVPGHLKFWDRNAGWIVGGICRIIARRLGVDRHIGWIKEAERACSSLRPRDVDAILVSGSPFVAFRLAKRLSERLGRPYVLDYRDPWTGNPHTEPELQQSIRREEARLLNDCAAATVVSPSWGEALDRCYGVGEKVHVIANGYDSSDMAAVEPYDFGHCAIVYTGNFYPPKRVISPFLMNLSTETAVIGASTTTAEKVTMSANRQFGSD